MARREVLKDFLVDEELIAFAGKKFLMNDGVFQRYLFLVVTAGFVQKNLLCSLLVIPKKVIF